MSVYLTGVVLFLIVIDEPLPSRLGIAATWPVPIGILAVVVVILLLTLCMFWWPFALILTALVSGGLVLWCC